MNWQLPLLFAEQTKEQIIKSVSDANNGTGVPESALKHQGDFWFPRQASEFAPDVDFLYYGIFWISAVFFVAIVAFMIYFCIKYRRRNGVIDPQPSSAHNTTLEIAWSVLPSVLLVWMFWYGAEGFFNMRVPRADAEEIQVTAARWNWVFTYPDGDSSSELHLVNNRPTKLVMQSTDVLHSMFIPAFRQKVDIVPGRYTYAYLTPNMEGEFRLACTEYCGQGHSKMRTLCKVHASPEARKADTQWIKAEHPPWENGERTYKINCSGCHKIEGAGTGPQFTGLWGKEGGEEMMDGEMIPVDENYIQESIWYPEKKVVKGYGPVSKMNSFKGKLSAEDITEVIAFLKYLNDPKAVSAEPAAGDGAEDTTTPEEEKVEEENDVNDGDA